MFDEAGFDEIGFDEIGFDEIAEVKRWLIIIAASLRQWLDIRVRGTQYLEIIPKLRQWLSIIWRR